MIQSGRMEYLPKGGDLCLDPSHFFTIRISHPSNTPPRRVSRVPNLEAITIFQGTTISLSIAHLDESQNKLKTCKISGSHGFHELDHDLKMWLPETHSHTSTLGGHKTSRRNAKTPRMKGNGKSIGKRRGCLTQKLPSQPQRWREDENAPLKT